MKKKQILLGLFLLFIGLMVVSCSKDLVKKENKDSFYENGGYEGQVNIQTKLKQIKTKGELRELLLKETSLDLNKNIGIFSKEETLGGKLGRETFSKNLEGSRGNLEFSKTNNQVEGVDEADIVKTDGNYIYLVTRNSVLIVRVYPVNKSKLIKRIEFNGSNKDPINLFIFEDKLIIISNVYNKEYRVSEHNLIPYYYYETQTLVEIYNIKNKDRPQKIKEYKISGSYYDARLVRDEIMLISRKNIDLQGDVNFPFIYKDGLKIGESLIYYFRMFPDSMYYTITLFSLKNLDKYYSESYVLGTTSTLYVSNDNIYLAYRKQIKEKPIERFREVIYPLIDSNQRSIFDKHIERRDKEAIKISFEQYFNNLDNDKQKKLIKKISEKNQEYQEKINSELRKTIIHKLSMKNGTLFYIGKQEIEGYLLNQFSMDEYKGMLRIATTKSYWIRGEGVHMYNNLYVLDEKLNYLGWIERVAEDERIYATRFIKDKLYMVTYRQIDPLFIIDLSIPEQPRIQGKLKISGFSSYLHPLGENFLIGVGKETKIINNRTMPVGIKISLFEVSSKEPKEVSSYVLNGTNLDSIVLREHKAFLFIPSRRFIVVPIYDYNYNSKEESKSGVYIFEITKEGIKLKTALKQRVEKKYLNYENRVVRDLYIKNYLYTISQKTIGVMDLNLLEEILKIDLKNQAK